MKFSKVASGAALAAALAGAGLGGYQAHAPNTGTMSDNLEVTLIPGSAAPTPSVADTSPAPAPTPADLPVTSDFDAREWHLLAALYPDDVARKLHDLEVTEMAAGAVHLAANLEVVLRGPDGAIKDYRYYPNKVVNTGVDAAIRMIVGDNTGTCPTVACGNSANCANPAKFVYFAVGTGTSSALAIDTSCGSELTIGGGYSRVAAGAGNIQTVSNGQLKLTITFNAGNATAAITEACLMNASTSGVMLARRVFSAVNKGASDSLQLSWTISLVGT